MQVGACSHPKNSWGSDVRYDYDRRGAYDYQRRRVANASEQLVAFDRIIEHEEARVAETLKAPDDPRSPYRIAASLKVMFDLLVRAGAQQLFLEVLRNYEMPAMDRKVIERAAKTFGKTRLLVKTETAVATYEKTIYEYKEFSDTARSVMLKNERHTDEGSTTATKVGSFTVINTGGFSQKVMDEAIRVVAKSEALLRKKGLGRVCYGDVHITNTVYHGTRVIAFYMHGDDSVYIRANLKGKAGPAITSVVHELGHRLQFKFLESKKREINAMYETLARKHGDVRHELVMDRSRWPKAGDTYVYKGETFAFDKVDLTRRSELTAVFRLQDRPSLSISIPLAAYIAEKDPEAQTKSSVFVTNYAMKDAVENFAEMIAFYCEDQLPADQIEMLEAIVG